MDVGADAAGQVISLAGQVFKIGMEGMVVVVKIAGKGAAHAAALLAAALSGKKKTKGKVMLRNMLRDSKGITLFTLKESDLKKFAKEAKAYNVRYCIVKDKKQDRDGNIDMFIRAEDAAVVNRIIERFGLTAVKQDVYMEKAPEAQRAEGEAYEGGNYVYGDVTISREVNSLVEEESETQIKTRVPGTFGKNVRYVYFDKAGLREAHGGKSYKVHIEPEGSYELYDQAGAVAETVSGEELLMHYDRHDNEVIPGNSKARTASEAQSGKSYSAWEDKANETGGNPSKEPDTGKKADAGQPDYVYGDITISREVNSLVEEESETQIKTRVPGTYGKNVRYVYFDKAGLEEANGGKSYKAHIEPEKKYELYNKAGAVAETVYGEELLTHYDRKDKDAAPENQEAVKTETSPKAASEKSYEDAVHEGSKNAEVPDTKNRFNRFSQRTYDFDAMEKELLSNNEPLKSAGDVKPDKSSERWQELEPAPEENPGAADGTIKTNMGDMPVEDYREIVAGQYGFDSYDELYAAGLRIGGGYDKEPEPEPVLEAADVRLPRTEPRTEAEMRPSVREKLSGYKKEEQDNALERQIKAAEAKRERESRRLEREGGDVLPEQRAKMESYTKSRDAAMADFLSDAKITERR